MRDPGAANPNSGVTGSAPAARAAVHAPLTLPLRDGVLDDREARTQCPSATNNVCSRVAVSRCLSPVQRTDSASRACSRDATASHTGRGRGAAATFRLWGRLVQVLTNRDPRPSELPSHRPLRSTLHQHLVPDHMDLIDPEHPPSAPRIPRSGNSTIRPSSGRLPSGEWPISERRAHGINRKVYQANRDFREADFRLADRVTRRLGSLRFGASSWSVGSIWDKSGPPSTSR